MPDSARLEIHIFNVSQGDSILIVHRDVPALAANLQTTIQARKTEIGTLSDAEITKHVDEEFADLDLDPRLKDQRDDLVKMTRKKVDKLVVGALTGMDIVTKARAMLHGPQIDEDLKSARHLLARYFNIIPVDDADLITKAQAKFTEFVKTKTIPEQRADLEKIVDADELARQALAPIDLTPFAFVRYPKAFTGTVIDSLLIDGGESKYGGDVLSALIKYGVIENPDEVYCPKLKLMVTHYHSDHVDGLFALLNDIVDPKAKRKDRTFKTKYRPKAVYYPAYDAAADAATGTFQTLDERLTAFQTEIVPVATDLFAVRRGGLGADNKPIEISLGKGVANLDITVRIIAANGAAFGPTNTVVNGTPITDPDGKVYGPGFNFVVDPASVTDLPKDPNDRSLVSVLQYGSFLALLTGDAAGIGTAAGENGAYSIADGASSHGDIEELFVPALKQIFPANGNADQRKSTGAGRCTLLKVGHHGSDSSTDIRTLKVVQPEIVAISSGVLTSFFKHPTPEVLHRLAANPWGTVAPTVPNSVGGKLFITEIASEWKTSSDSTYKAFASATLGGNVMGDICIRPLDAELEANWKAAACGTNQLKVVVYGSGEQTRKCDLANFSLRTCTDLGGPKSEWYPNGVVTLTLAGN